MSAGVFAFWESDTVPFKSEAQRRFLYAKHPHLAREFEAKTPKGADLPEHVKTRRKHSAAMNRRLRGG